MTRSCCAREGEVLIPNRRISSSMSLIPSTLHRPQLRTLSPVSPHFGFRNPALHCLQSHTSHPLRPHVMAHAVWRFSTSSTLRGGIIWRRYFLFFSSLFFSSLARARGDRCGNSLRNCLLSRFLPLFGLLADCESARSRQAVGYKFVRSRRASFGHFRNSGRGSCRLKIPVFFYKRACFLGKRPCFFGHRLCLFGNLHPIRHHLLFFRFSLGSIFL